MLKRKTENNQQLIDAKRQAIANARRYGVAKAASTDVKKRMTAKVSNKGSNLKFVVSNVWTKSDEAAGGSETANAVLPTLDNTKIVCRLVMPSDAEIEGNTEMTKFTDEYGNFGVQMSGYVSDTQRQRAKEWNNVRANLKQARRAMLASSNPHMSEEQIERDLVEVYGEDLNFDGYAERFYVNKDNWLQLPAEVGYNNTPGCVGAGKALKAQPMDAFTLNGVGFSFWVPELKVAANAEAEYRARFVNRKNGPRHALPSGRPAAFLKSSGCTMSTVRDETVLEALRQIDDAQPNAQNLHLVNWLPSLSDLVELSRANAEERGSAYFGPVMQRFTSAPNFDRFGESSGMVTRVTIDTEKLTAGGNEASTQFPMVKLFVTPTQWKESEENLANIEIAGINAVEEAMAEGITDKDEINDYVKEAVALAKAHCAFNPEQSVGFQYGINLSLYSRHHSEMNKPSQLSTCPIGSPVAWKAFAPTLLASGLDFCVSHKVAVKDSAAHPGNNDAAALLESTPPAKRFLEPMHVLNCYASRVFFNWAQLVQSKCVPLSAAGAKALYDNTSKCDDYAALQLDGNIVKALNEMHPNTIATFFTGAKRVPVASCKQPRYEFFALVPYTFDDRALKVFAKLREAYAEGYNGPLGELLLDESYTPEDAQALNAHPSIVEEKPSRVPLSGDQLANAYVLVVDTAELAKVTSPEIVRKCMRDMFGIFQEEEAAAAPANDQHAAEGEVDEEDDE